MASTGERPRYPKLLIALIRRLLKQHPGLSRDDFDAAFRQARAAAGGHARAEQRATTQLADDSSEDSFEELIAEVQNALQAAFGGNCWSVATYDNSVVYYVGAQTTPDSDDEPGESLSPWDDAFEEAVEDGQPDGDNDADDATTFYKVTYSRDDNGQITFGEQQEVEKDVSWVADGEEGDGPDAYEEEIDELEDALYAMYGNRCRIVASYPDRVIYCLRNGDSEEHWEQDYSEDEKAEKLTFGDKRKVSMNVEWTPVAAEDSRLVRLLTQSYGISEVEANEILALAYAKAGASESASGGKPTLPKNVQAMPAAKQRQWVDVWNQTYKNCQKKGGSNCEKTAFQFANGVLKREKAAGTSVKGEDVGITTPDGEIIYLAQKFSDKPWKGNASKYGSTDAYCKACLIDDNPPGQDKVQSNCLAPWTPVFTRSGWKRADAVTTDDELLTTDLTWGRVTQLHVRTYDGPLYVIAGASLTSTHPVLTGRGWVHIHDVDPIEDVLYLLREVVDRPTFNVRFAEAHQMVASARRISRESDVASLSSGQGVPVVSVYFDDDIAAWNERVGNKAANTALSDVSNIQRVEGHIESTLDAGRNAITVCPDRMVLPTRLRTELATFLNDSRRMCQELEFGAAFQANPNLANIIQDRSTPGQGSDATGITTEFIGVVSEFVGNTELHPAGNTDVCARSAANAVMAKLSTTGRAASLSRAVDSIDICAEFLPASDAGAPFSPNDGARRTCGSGLTENALRGFRSGDESNLHGAIIPQYTGHVYNFEVAGHPSYFAGLLGVHNCKLPYKTPDGAISRPALRAIAAVLGGARGGVKGVSPQSLAKAKKKHAALMKQAGIGDADVKASLDYQLAATDADKAQFKNHAPMTVTHMHEHPDMGQDDGDGDGTHMHKHTHAGDNSHRHSHANTNIADIESGKSGAGTVKASLDHQLVLDDGDATHPLPKRLSRIDWSQRAFAPVVLRLSDNDIPVWQQLHKIGKWVIPHASGQKIAMTRDMGDAIIRNFRAGVVRRGVPLDERHFTDGGGHALGWLEEIRWGSEGQGLPNGPEPDGSGPILYGRFRYNDIGLHKLRNEHYKHISPQYHLNYCDNEIGACYGPAMLAVASTNNPYLRVRDLQGNPAPQPVAVLDDGLIGFESGGNDMADNIQLEEMKLRLEAAERQLEAERKERHKTNIEAYLDKEIRGGLTPAVARIAKEILLNSAPEMEAVICLSNDPANSAPTHNLHDAVKALLKEIPHVPVGQVYAHQEDVRPYDPEQATKLDEQLIPQWTKGLLELAKLDDPRRIDSVLTSTARQDG